MSSSGLCMYKDEVTELKDKFNSSENQRDPVKYKHLIQQVILCMTKGIDMTPLFMTIVKAAATKDLVQKKLCYHYLCHYASSHADLALLTVNTLKRDAEDTNYMVRGLALRSIGSLRLPTVVEYTKDVMFNGLKDHSSYVRKAAVIGCLQLYKLAPDEINEENLNKLLNERMTKDKDYQVRQNCMFVFEEMFNKKNSSKMHKFLLKRLPKFDEWGLQFALEVLMACRPDKEEEIYKTLNNLDVCLKHANTSVVLGAVRVFLYFTSELPQLQEDVFKRIKVPLLTALTSKSPEIAYSVACHIDVILHQCCPALFEDSISSFYCRYDDPLYLRIKKLDVLSKLVTESNGKQILDELSYHSRHRETASYCIHHIGMIALLHPWLAEMCMEKLFSFLDSRDDSIVSHTLAALRDLLLKLEKYSDFVPSVKKYLKRHLLPDGKASVIWMLAEFGESIPEAPYVLESLIEDIEKESSPVIKLELLTATTKLFFKRPPECQAMLGHLLEHCIEHENNVDIRDRAILYYRLLKVDVNKAKEVICCSRSAQLIDHANIVMTDSKKFLLEEFNTLSVVYGQLSSGKQQRLSNEHEMTAENIQDHKYSRRDSRQDDFLDESMEKQISVAVDKNLVQIDSTDIEVDSNSSKEFLAPVDQNISPTDESKSVDIESIDQPVLSGSSSLLLIDPSPTEDDIVDLCERTAASTKKDLDNIDSTFQNKNFEQREAVLDSEDNQYSLESDLSLLKLIEEPDLSPDMFESLWQNLPETESYEIDLDELPNQDEFLKLLASRRIYTMASTAPGAEHIRYFFYAQSDSNILCEVTVHRTTLKLNSFIKMEDPTNVHAFIEMFQNCLEEATKT